MRPVGTEDAWSNVDGINGQFRLETATDSNVVSYEVIGVRYQFLEKLPRPESGWCLTQQFRANTKEMETRVERVLVESGEPSMFSVSDK